VKWVKHEEGFSSLMLGRIELAQISRSRNSDNCLCILSFTRDQEQKLFHVPSEADAKRVCEKHANKVINS